MVTVSDVENLSSTAWDNLSSGRKTALLEQAETLVDGQLSQRTSNFPTIEGDRDDAKLWLAAHLYETAEGGESQSENTQGGSVTFNTVTGEWQSSLSETRYGRILSDMYLRDRQSVSIVRPTGGRW